jgi:hypothetical protein
MGRGPGIVKRSGRDKPMWVAIHKGMEATLGISLYSKAISVVSISEGSCKAELLNQLRRMSLEQTHPDYITDCKSSRAWENRNLQI